MRRHREYFMSNIRTTIYDWNRSCYSPSGDCAGQTQQCAPVATWFWLLAGLGTVIAFAGGRR